MKKNRDDMIASVPTTPPTKRSLHQSNRKLRVLTAWLFALEMHSPVRCLKPLLH